MKWNGIFPALVTPFTNDGKISEKALEQLINMNLAAGVRGFYVGGSTAEAFLLSMEERKYLLDIAADVINGRGTLIYHIGCIGTEQAIELGMHAKRIGVDAISSISPFYYKFSFSEIRDYYFDIVEAVGLPMIAYNFPSLSGVTLTAENVRELNERIIGVKHTSMDLYQLERMKEVNKDIIVFNGHDEVFLGGLAMGADGAIGSTFNFMADRFIRIKELYEAGEYTEAKREQSEANKIIEVLKMIGVLQGIKYILGKKGIACGECRKPFKCLSAEDKALLDSVTPRDCYKII